ncbi:MAG: plasmid maintenance system killer family protein [Chloroflexi bacterium]|nr:plasmid maintenance system killer family protein [Chloroflexota bacterium]
MIETFASDETEQIYRGQVSKKLPKDIQRTARRKLLYLDDAEDLQDLLAPPGNRLEKLKGDRAGQHSIRINDQWRICFKWSGNMAQDVEIVDYHG